MALCSGREGHMFLSQYDRIVVISLPSRKDRRQQMSRQSFPFEFFNAIRPETSGPFSSIGAYGCFLSHLEVLSHGGSVLILEDDCVFTDQRYCVPEGTDIFYGSHDHDSNVMIGAHCMGFSARAAKLAAAYLSGLLDGSVPADPQASAEPDYNPNILPPVDGAYVWFRRAHPELVTVFKRVANQRSSRSDITPGRLDRIPVLNSVVNMARASR
jgi:glycosyl transferase family 25